MFVSRLTSVLKKSISAGVIQKRIMSSGDPKMHEMIAPLSWLLGKWRSETEDGEGKFPTVESFNYGEELEFFHVGQPNIQFAFGAWKKGTKAPMHRESGFIRIQPGTNKIAFISAHNNGVCEMEEGEVNGQKLETTSHTIGRMTFSKPPKTIKLKRTYVRNGDTLEYTLFMETDKTPLTQHLHIKYKKV